MIVKPKFRLGQKVILIGTRYLDGKYDVGYVCGIEVKRSYASAGIFQNGGLSCAEIKRKGYTKTWMDNCDAALYKVIHAIHTTGSVTTESNVLENDIVPYTKENKLKYEVGVIK